MGALIIVLIVVCIIAFNYHLSTDTFSQTCPYCGKKARQTGKMIERRTGKPVYFYKCSCGHEWTSHKCGD